MSYSAEILRLEMMTRVSGNSMLTNNMNGGVSACLWKV